MDGPAGGSELDGWRRPQTPAGLQLHSGLTGPSPPYTPLCTSGMGVGEGNMESGVTDGDRADPQPKGCCVPTLAPCTEGLKENETGVKQDGATC